jgi:hypothetical protein
MIFTTIQPKQSLPLYFLFSCFLLLLDVIEDKFLLHSVWHVGQVAAYVRMWASVSRRQFRLSGVNTFGEGLEFGCGQQRRD